MSSLTPVRLGILGTAAVADYAMITPARKVGDMVVQAVASRDPARARAFADKHGIIGATDYDSLIADPALDAIYVALPNSMHAEWSLKALGAGKAVLCEKPLTANADEARELVAAASLTGQPLIEAFHWRCHPVAARIARIVQDRELGEVREIEVRFGYSRALLQPDDIRLDYARGGGVLMDSGCYCVNLLRMAFGEPIGVAEVAMELWSAQVDGSTVATLDFGNGSRGRVVASNMDPVEGFDCACIIRGELGQAMVHNPFLTGLGCSIDFERNGTHWSESLGSTPTYTYQAQNFAGVVRGTAVSPTPANDAIGNMAAIDMIYQAAGLMQRGLA